MKLITSLFVLIGLAGLFAYATSLSPYGDSEASGRVTVQVHDASGEMVIDATYDFGEDDTLFDVLKRHHTIDYDARSGAITGRVILGIDAVTTDFETDFLAILITGRIHNRHGEALTVERQFSSVGIDLLPLLDGNTYIFEHRDVGSFKAGD
ncbi:MAG: hypothetical protein EA374_00705 [Acholeplasmatales bacterium]|nr:MAG: hypothetical protein EA374_00705 [Acholeplasmatales bacterium]